MNYQALIYFKTLAELKHYTRAAAKLYISQPALTKSIHNLELELGAPLFQRDGRNIALTNYGTLFYPYAKKAIESINDGIEAFTHLLNTETNVIFMSCLYSMYSFFLTEKITQFRQLHPNYTFSLEYKFTTAILNDVLERHSELGICSDFYATEKFTSIDCALLYKEPVCFIVGKHHPLAKRKIVEPVELIDFPFIPYHQSRLGTNKIMYDICAPFGKEPIFSTDGYSDIGVLNLVAMNEGFAIVPASSYLHLDHVVQLNVNIGKPLFRNVNLIWNKDYPLSKIGASFRTMLLSQANFDKNRPSGFLNKPHSQK